MASQYVELLTPDDTFDWSPKAADGTPYASAFKLRIVPDDVEKKLRREATGKPSFHRGTQIDNFDSHKFIASVLDHAVVSWSGVRMRGDEAPRTRENILLLPEKWKSEINRMCLGKEAGEEVAADEVAGADGKKP